MRISSFIARRIAFNQQKTFSRFIIRLSISATVISVAAMIITVSFVNGFQETVSNKIFSFWGHIHVTARQPMKSNLAEEIPILRKDSLQKVIGSKPVVKSIFSFATKYALLKTGTDMEGLLVKGVESTYDFHHLDQFLKQGRWIHYNDSSYAREIVVSAYSAGQLGLKLNDKVLIYFIRPDGSLRPDKLSIVGIYKTGIEDYDKTYAIGDLRLIQKLNGWQPNEIGGYEIFLHDYRKMDVVSNDIFDLHQFPQEWESKPIHDLYPNIFDWLNIQDTNQAILITIMVIIALINLITCLIILVLERVRMIGILKALGAGNLTIRKIFLNHALIITLSGILLGTFIALLLLYTQQKSGFISLPEDAYYMDKASVKIIWWQVVLIDAGTLLVTLLVLQIPSLIVKRIMPVKAIRFS